jgi:hypothetical protein
MLVQRMKDENSVWAVIAPLALLSTCLIHSGENVLDKVLTVVGADLFNRRSGLMPTNAIFINQSFMTWGLRE